MTTVRLLSMTKTDPPVYIPRRKVFDLSEIDGLIFCVMEAGMKSGEPSVIIIAEPSFINSWESVPGDPGTSVFFQTSLDKFLAAAAGLKAMAETRFGWEQQEGHFSIMPPSPEARRKLLEAIKKELEEWGDAEGMER